MNPQRYFGCLFLLVHLPLIGFAHSPLPLNLEQLGGSVILSYQSEPDRFYRLFESEDLQDYEMISLQVGNGQIQSFTITTD